MVAPAAQDDSYTRQLARSVAERSGGRLRTRTAWRLHGRLRLTTKQPLRTNPAAAAKSRLRLRGSELRLRAELRLLVRLRQRLVAAWAIAAWATPGRCKDAVDALLRCDTTYGGWMAFGYYTDNTGLSTQRGDLFDFNDVPGST